MSDQQNHFSTSSLPPRLPQTRREVERIIILLGERKKSESNARARRELETLIGVYPTVEQAALWKRMLRRVCLEVIQAEKPEAQR